MDWVIVFLLLLFFFELDLVFREEFHKNVKVRRDLRTKLGYAFKNYNQHE